MKRDEHWKYLSALYRRVDENRKLRTGDTSSTSARRRIEPLSTRGNEQPLAKALISDPSEVRQLASNLAQVDRAELVSDREMEALEAIVHQELRPAILVQDGQPLAYPADWAHLQAHGDAISRAIFSTGRIEIEGDPGLEWIGTGFVIDQNLLATNRHVLSEAAFKDSRHGWQFRERVSLKVDFAEEIGVTHSREVAVTGIWGVHSHYDIAILRMGAGCPPPLYYSPRPSRPGQEVVTIGYPAFDSRRNDAAAMHSVFRGIYDVKRLMPGEVMGGGTDPFLVRHDCSTLGGNSGSPIIEPHTGHVVGIHFRGFYLRWNEGVDLTPNIG